MRKLTLTLAAAGAALAFAAPASAQYFPQPGYGQGYGYHNYGHVRSLQARVDGIQRQIDFLYHRRAITRNERNGLQNDARNVEYRLRRAASYGLNPYEARDIESRIYRLERHISREVRDGRGWDHRRYGGYSGYGYPDRDRDGRDDRREDDRGWDHD